MWCNAREERCPDYMDPKYKQIEDMFGDDLSKQELKVIVDKLMIIDMAKTIAPRDMHGAWALHRDVYNDRGDESSQLARQRSTNKMSIQGLMCLLAGYLMSLSQCRRPPLQSSLVFWMLLDFTDFHWCPWTFIDSLNLLWFYWMFMYFLILSWNVIVFLGFPLILIWCIDFYRCS